MLIHSACTWMVLSRSCPVVSLSVKVELRAERGMKQRTRSVAVSRCNSAVYSQQLNVSVAVCWCVEYCRTYQQCCCCCSTLHKAISSSLSDLASSTVSWCVHHYYTVSQKTQKCNWESKKSDDALFSHLSYLVLQHYLAKEETQKTAHWCFMRATQSNCCRALHFISLEPCPPTAPS